MTRFYDPKTKTYIDRSWSNVEDIEKMITEAKANGWEYRCSHMIDQAEIDEALNE